MRLQHVAGWTVNSCGFFCPLSITGMLEKPMITAGPTLPVKLPSCYAMSASSTLQTGTVNLAILTSSLLQCNYDALIHLCWSLRKPTEVEWKYTEEGERVRVSVRTGRIIPKPIVERRDGIVPQQWKGKTAWACVCVLTGRRFFYSISKNVLFHLRPPCFSVSLMPF